jgi:hypothetical protein
MPCSGMLRRVAVVRTNVSEESSAPINSVTLIGVQRALVASYC